MTASDGDGTDLQLTAEEARVIQETRAAGVSVGQLLDHAKAKNVTGGAGEQDKAVTRGDVNQLLNERDQRDQVTRSRAARVQAMSTRIQGRISGNARLAGKTRRGQSLEKAVMQRIPDTPALAEAKTMAEFDAALDKLVDEEITAELKDIDEIAAAEAHAGLDATLDAQRDAGPGPGAGSSAGQGSSTPGEARDNDFAIHPVYGLGVKRPTDAENEAFFAADLKRFEAGQEVPVAG